MRTADTKKSLGTDWPVIAFWAFVYLNKLLHRVFFDL